MIQPSANGTFCLFRIHPPAQFNLQMTPESKHSNIELLHMPISVYWIKKSIFWYWAACWCVDFSCHSSYGCIKGSQLLSLGQWFTTCGCGYTRGCKISLRGHNMDNKIGKGEKYCHKNLYFFIPPPPPQLLACSFLKYCKHLSLWACKKKKWNYISLKGTLWLTCS